MKNILYLLIVLVCSSCSLKTTMATKSPEEVKMMTSKQFDSNQELVYKASLSLLQSEGFMIESADAENGLIKAYKRIENTNANRQLLWMMKTKNASIAKLAIFVESLNAGLTDVKMTVYEGADVTTLGAYGARHTKVTESMVYDAEIYAKWFNALRVEVERRKSLL